MLLTVTVDRFENGTAVLIPAGARDGRDQILMPTRFLPSGAREGKVLDFDIAVNEAKTAEARQRVRSLLDELDRLSGPKKEPNQED